MKIGKKILLLTLCTLLVIGASVLSTMAYFTSTDTVTNVFTIGKVHITLDEALVNADGLPIDTRGNTVSDLSAAQRVQANEYLLIPGHVYTKDPTVTVSRQSEEAYVRMIVTINKQQELDDIFAAVNAGRAAKDLPPIGMTDIFGEYDAGIWQPVRETENADNTRSYEFRYAAAASGTVAKSDSATGLPALFTSIRVPGEITQQQLALLYSDDGIDNDLKIEVVAHAIQADGFDNADDAWDAFDN